MAISALLSYKLLMYLNLGNAIGTIVSIIIAIIVYGFFVIKINILSTEELKQLPFGDKLCKKLKKT